MVKKIQQTIMNRFDTDKKNSEKNLALNRKNFKNESFRYGKVVKIAK